MPTLYIVRGLPGSGKSTLAKQLVPKHHFEADMFHTSSRTGEYLFDPTMIKESHEWCYKQVETCIIPRKVDVVVSNTFTQTWEMEPYMELAERWGYQVQIIECHGHWDNIHDVPEDVITKMEERWEPTVVPRLAAINRLFPVGS